MAQLEISRYKLIELLLKSGIPGDKIVLGDEFYSILSENDVSVKFAKSWTSIMSQLGYEYQEENNDCEDFALGASFWMRFFHSKQKKPLVSGVAFGEIWCKTITHGFCFAVHRDDNKNDYLEFYEPQILNNGFSMGKIKLTKKDLQSAIIVKA